MVSGNAKDHVVPKAYKVLFGGMAGIVATCVVHPLDMMKVRLQLDRCPNTLLKVFLQLLRRRPLALYSGLTAGLLRQCTYTASRLGVFNCLTDMYIEEYGTRPGLGSKVIIGACAGLTGAVVGSPSEVILVRMMADGVKPARERRYRNAIHALYKIRKTEGLRGLWRGGMTNLGRACILSVVQITTYVQAYESWKDYEFLNGYKLHLCAATVSSLATACFSLPIDNVKTIYQADSAKRNLRGVIGNVWRTGGIRGLYHGFVPYCARLTIHTSIAFFALEELVQYYSGRSPRID